MTLGPPTGAELLRSGQRFAVTMWEYSWLVQRSGDQAEYADWDKVLDEVVERGYDCLRIDAYPHLVASGPDGKVQQRFTMNPIARNFMWGNHRPVEINPRQGLAEFMHKARDRGLYFGLSSWFNNDTTDRKFMVRDPQGYVRIWTETLEFLGSEGLLDRVIWVDLCNEFPMAVWAPGAFQDIFRTPRLTDRMEETGQDWRSRWSPDEQGRFRAYFPGAARQMARAFPELYFTFSFESAASNNVLQMPAPGLSVAEPHMWATDDEPWYTESGMSLLNGEEGYEQNIVAYVERCRRLGPSFRAEHERSLGRRMDAWAAWAKQNGLRLITSEGWVNVFYEDISEGGAGDEWDWFKEVSESAVNLAIEKGWQGICTSNFAEPHFEGMWKDVAWHRRLTERIRRASPVAGP